MYDFAGLAEGFLLVAVVLTSVEYISLLRNKHFFLLRGRLVTAQGTTGGEDIDKRAAILLLALLCARVVVAIVLLSDSWDDWAPSFFFFLSLSGLLAAVCLPFGTEGADQLSIFLCFAAGINYLPDSWSLGSEIVSYLVIIQMATCYVTSGVAKLLSPVWRDGTGLSGVMFTRIYGSPEFFSIVGLRPWMWRVAAWTVMMAEVSFLLTLLLPFEWAIVIIAILILFHLLTAVFMGLFAFFLTFSAGLLSVASSLEKGCFFF